MKLLEVWFRHYLGWEELDEAARRELYSQYHPTWILLGRRRTHGYNVTEGWWRVGNRPVVQGLARPGTVMVRSRLRELARAVGWPRALLEAFEVAVGFRALGRLLDWRRPKSYDFSRFEPPR